MQLRRVTFGSIVRVLLPAVAVLALISGLAGLDLAELANELRDATWWLVALGFILAQLPRVTQAVTTLGAAPVSLPLGPVYALQLAVSYINLAIPTSAARVAIGIRFFQRHGVPPGSAVAAGAIDGFTSLVMEAVLLAVLLLFTPASLDLDLAAAVDSAVGILVVVMVIAAAGLGMVAAVAPWRRFVLKLGAAPGFGGMGRRAGIALTPADRPAARRQPGDGGALRPGTRDVRPGSRVPGRARRGAA
ncbi:MAG: lysylphosphatidylglycerol synthase domain-containing protein, partial [Acidimicrobiales bacterium]